VATSPRDRHKIRNRYSRVAIARRGTRRSATTRPSPIEEDEAKNERVALRAAADRCSPLDDVHVRLWVPMASNWSLIPGIAQSKNRQRTAKRLVGYGHREDCNWSTSPSHPWLPFASTVFTVDIRGFTTRFPLYFSSTFNVSRTRRD